MTKVIKNKDGIKLLIGQVWEDDSSKVRTVVGFTSKGKAVTESEIGSLRSWEQAGVFHRLLSCPVMGDMSNHLIVTAEQRKLYKVPDCTEWWSEDYENRWNMCSFLTWNDSFTYRVPADFTDWEPIEPSKPEVDDTLRFTLNWDEGYSRFNCEEHEDGMYWVSQCDPYWNGFIINGTRYAFSHFEKDGECFSYSTPSRKMGDRPFERADTIVFKRFEIEED